MSLLVRLSFLASLCVWLLFVRLRFISVFDDILTETANVKAFSQVDVNDCPVNMKQYYDRTRSLNPEIAIVFLIPYRDRETDMKQFLACMRIFSESTSNLIFFVIAEQFDSFLFNRGLLFNVGYKEAENWIPPHIWNSACLIGQDVDSVPLVGVDFSDCDPPTHFASQDDRGYGKHNIFFGISSGMKSYIWKKVNGLSNKYWGWGKEDHDFLFRIQRVTGTKKNRRLNFGRFVSLSTVSVRSVNPEAEAVKDNSRSQSSSDGISSLNYSVAFSWETHAYNPLLWVGVSAFPIIPLSVRVLAAPGLCKNEQFTMTSTPASWDEFIELIQCNHNTTVVLLNHVNIAVVADDADMLHRWLRNLLDHPGLILVLPVFHPTPSIPRTIPIAVGRNKKGWPVVEVGTPSLRYFDTMFSFDAYDPKDHDLLDPTISRICINKDMKMEISNNSACHDNYFYVPSGDTFCVERGKKFDQIERIHDCGSDGWTPQFRFKSASLPEQLSSFIIVCDSENKISFDCNDDKLWLIKSHTIDSSAVHFHKTNTSLEWAHSNDELTYQAQVANDEQIEVWCIGFIDKMNNSVCIHKGRCDNNCHKGSNVRSFDFDDIDSNNIKFMRDINYFKALAPPFYNI